jgi:hypothetical protein
MDEILSAGLLIEAVLPFSLSSSIPVVIRVTPPFHIKSKEIIAAGEGIIKRCQRCMRIVEQGGIFGIATLMFQCVAFGWRGASLSRIYFVNILDSRKGVCYKSIPLQLRVFYWAETGRKEPERPGKKS